MIVVTGSELVRGERADLNGPFLARALLDLGLDPVRIHVVGDDPAELEAAVEEAVAAADLVATSGGLGPTHDDRTVEVVAKVAGAPLRVDTALEGQIETVSRMVAERLQRPYTDFSAGVTKQATVPEPSTILGLAGTAPGLVVDAKGTPVVILPGPPPELQRLWPRALEVADVRRVLEQGTPPLRRTLRFFGLGESQVARAFQEAGGDGDGLEVTICARNFEIHVDLVAEPGAEARLAALQAALDEGLGRHLYSTDGRSVEELVLEGCRELGWTIATAESCTGGLVAGALTAVSGSSDAVVGGIVAYADEVKTASLGVPPELLERHGAVSAEVAEAMARGARERLGVDVAVAVTGVAGPGGGTDEKPVGLVYFHAETPSASHGSSFSFPGDRESIRRRSVVASLHLVRRLLEQSRDKAT
ncbi:MAG: competence/damage-inducible protein A [Gaiellaceae bacterium]